MATRLQQPVDQPLARGRRPHLVGLVLTNARGSRGEGRAASCLASLLRPQTRAQLAGPRPAYAPGSRYWTSAAWRNASIVSSTVRRTVVSIELSPPPPPIASATAAIDTLSGASQRLYPSCSPKAYQNPWSFPPTDSMYS